MLRRESTIHTVAWFADQYRLGKLNLNPPYQRKEGVWSKEYKAYFIDTILRNYPSPAIFLHVEISADGQTIYNVVDGKQRLTAILQFMNGDFVIPEKHAEAEYSKLEFRDLQPQIRTKFWEYMIPVQEVFNASEEELKSAFDRLNRNVAKLSNQELRHAKYDGKFTKLMETLTEEPFWGDLGISTRSTAKRMRDVEFVSEIFLLTMHGILDGTASETLDNYYQDYDEEIPNQDEGLRHYRSCVRMFEDLGLERIKNSRFKNFSDFYSLWAALLECVNDPRAINYQATMENLIDFEQRLAAYSENPNMEGPQEDVVIYYDNVRQGVNKATNRKARADILQRHIVLT